MTHEKLFIDRFISILVKHAIIKPEEGIAITKGYFASSIDNFIEFLVNENLVSKENILKGLAAYYQIPYFDVIGYFFKHDLLLKFPKDLLLRHEIIPLMQDEQILVMVASEPNNQSLLSILGNYVSYDIQFRVGIGADIIDAIEEFYDESLTVTQDEDEIDREDRRAV